MRLPVEEVKALALALGAARARNTAIKKVDGLLSNLPDLT